MINLKKTTMAVGVALMLANGAAHALSVMTMTSTGNNFTMLDADGASYGGTNDVTFRWDGTLATSTAQAALGVRNAQLSSPTAFSSNVWTAHHVTLYAPGSYTIYTGCAAASAADTAYNPACGLGASYTLNVAQGQIGAHMLFNWNTGTAGYTSANANIDVLQLYTPDAAFGSTFWAGGTNTVGNSASTVWHMQSIDTANDPDAYNGTKMIDGPFQGFSANFNLLAAGATITGTAPVFTAPAAVPVPAAAWLLGSGLIGLVGVARRRKAA